MLKRIALISLMVAAAFDAASAQSQTPNGATLGFYRWYIAELNAKHLPIEKNKPEIRKHVSARLVRWLYSPAYRDYDADYFLNAQDYDEAWSKTVTVSGGAVRGNTASTVVTFPKTKNFTQMQVTVHLVREAGAWKIDTVRARR